jgi:hypothetical protein
MRYVTSTIVAFTLTSVVGVFAQEQQAPAQPPTRAEAPAPQAAPTSTLTGCVVQLKTTDGGTAFVLNKAEGGPATMYVLADTSKSDWSTNSTRRLK